MLKLGEVKVSSAPANGIYWDTGEMIEFSLSFNGNVAVTGTPRFGFRLGSHTRMADYASGSDTDALFSYTVVSGDNHHDGTSWPSRRGRAQRRHHQVHARHTV